MKKKQGMPDLVYWGLLGIEKRSTAQGFLIACVVLGGFCLLAGMVVIGALLFAAAGWYHLAISWVDRHSGWEE